MPRCPDCGSLLSVHDSACPACASDRNDTDDDRSCGPELRMQADCDGSELEDRVAIARFRNGAEAGYFAEELVHETGIEAQVVAREHFNHMWTTEYILLVPASEAERGAEFLQGLVQATTDEDEFDPAADENDGCATAQGTGSLFGGPLWISVVVTLAAGSLAWWGVNRVEQRPRAGVLVVPDRRPPPDVWKALNASSAPWVQTLETGVREFRMDAQTRAAVIREDRDGDGQFERRWEFSW